MSYSNETHQFMSGGGAAGELLRNHDWFNTPLGDPAGWPDSLKTTVSIIIRSKYPMFVWWGPSLINIHNDAYAPLLGDKFPGQYGKSADLVWKEIWKDLLPLKELVFEKAESVYYTELLLITERRGFREETYFDFSYSPIFNEEGKVGGLFCTCQEVTGNVMRTRRLQNLSELKSGISIKKTQFEACTEAVNVLSRNNHDIPFSVIYRLNPGANSATYISGYGINKDCPLFPPELSFNDSSNPICVGLQTGQPDPPALIDHLSGQLEAIEGFFTDSIPDKGWRASLVNAPGQPMAYLMVLGVSPHQVFDDVYQDYFLQVKQALETTLSNINLLEEGLSQIEEMVEKDKEKTAYFLHINQERSQAERNMYKLLMNAPVGIAIYRGESFVIELVNDHMLELWDRTSEEVLNLPLFEAQPVLRDQGFDAIMLSVIRTGNGITIQEVPVTLMRGGSPVMIYVKLVCEPLYSDEGIITGVMALAHDITEEVLSRKKVEASETRFRDMIHVSPIAITILSGPEFRMDIINDEYLKIVGRSRADSIGKPIAEVLPEIVSQGVINLLTNVYDSGEPFVANDFGVDLQIDGRIERRYFTFSFKLLQDFDEAKSILVMASDVTYMVHSRFALEQSKKEFESTFRESPMGMTVLRGPQLIVENINTTMLERFWRREENEVKGKPYVEIFPELKGQKFPDILQKVLSSGMRYREIESEAIIQVGDQSLRYFVDFQYAPLFDAEGLVSGVMITAYDVTERVLDRRKLEEAEERSRLAIEATGLGTFDWDLRTQEFIFSKRLAEMFGCADKPDFGHMDLVNLIHPEDRPQRDAAVANCFAIGSLNYHARICWPDNTLHWMSVYGKIQYDADHNPIKMFGTALDISTEKNYQQALEKSEQRFRSLANFMPQFIWTTDEEGNLTYYNQAVLEFSGLSGSALSEGSWMQLVHPDERAGVYRKLEKAIQTGHEYEVEARFRNKEGIYRWQLGRSVALKDHNGKVQMWIGTSIDIHDRKMMSEELERRVNQRTAELKLANEELIRTNQELEQFAYVSSHDLQEPLRKIQTFSELVIKKLPSAPDNVKTHLEKIHTSAKRMSVLINDLLNYSRVSKSDENFISLDLNRVYENILNDFEVLIKQKRAVIKSEALPVMRGIPIQINQLFYNLISNALKFSTGNPVINITSAELSGADLPSSLPLNRERRYTVLKFADNGIGFDQAYASQIFTIFQRLNNRSQYSGTGIGLAICKKIAENHEGCITAESEINKGATFTVYLAK